MRLSPGPATLRLRVGLILLAAALAALAGCATASAQVASSITPTPTYRLGGKFATATAEAWTPTLPPDAAAHLPIAGKQLNWVATNLPAGFGFAYHSSWLDVSTDNGGVAYSCSQLGPSNALETVVTHDAGASWSRVANQSLAWDGCMTLIVDALNPRIVVLGGSAPPSYTPAYALTTNGGQSWRSGSSPVLTNLWALATVGARTYALSPDSANNAPPKLLVSVDGLWTWRDVSPPVGSQTIATFWANPATGSLLVESQQGYTGTTTLWQSHDGGSSWTRNDLTLSSVSAGGIGAVIASPLHDSSAWFICQNAAGGYCSTDSGATWHALPGLDDAGLRGYQIFGVTGDGSVLAQGSTDEDWPIYRLAPGATRWQALGPAPLSSGSLRYTSAPDSDGYIWSLPSVKGGGSGDANPSDVLVARYPY